ncbi:MAG: hypothetical protein H6746_11525 [Deltaproteobacteria bacterium]|nr:hypothetical protein [Deltaproteobacteria bacterium]
MSLRTLLPTVALACGLLACAPRAAVTPTPPPSAEQEGDTGEAEAPAEEEDPGEDSEQAPAVAVSEPRCAAVCAHIHEVSTGAPPDAAAAAWMAECTRRCLDYASDGQLACYERVVRADELSVCSVF